MPSNCASKRGGRRASRKNRKFSRKSRRVNRRNNMYGGEAPVNYSNPGPMDINLAQGEQFAKFHAQQHGGGALVGGPFPGAVTEGAFNPQGLMASARQDPLIQAYAEIKQYGPSSDNPNLAGGRRRRGSRKSRKSRKGSHKAQRGGVLVRWGGGRARKGSRNSHKGRKATRRRRSYRGGAFSGGLNDPMPVSDEGKMLIPENLLAQSGQNAEWALAKDPMAFAPIAK